MPPFSFSDISASLVHLLNPFFFLFLQSLWSSSRPSSRRGERSYPLQGFRGFYPSPSSILFLFFSSESFFVEFAAWRLFRAPLPSAQDVRAPARFTLLTILVPSQSRYCSPRWTATALSPSPASRRQIFQAPCSISRPHEY